MWEGETSQGTGLQSCECYLQRVWQKGTLQKGLPARQTLCTLSGDLTDDFGRRWGQ